MFEHIQILSYVLLILSATWLVFYIHSVYNKYPYRYIGAIRNYNIAIIFLFAIRFMFFYVGKNLIHDMEAEAGALLLGIFSYSLAILVIIMVYLMLQCLLQLRDSPLSRQQSRLFQIVLLFIAILFALAYFFPGNELPVLRELSDIVTNSFVFNLVIYNLEFLMIICFYFIWEQGYKDRERKRISKLFALAYMLCNAVSLSVLFLLMYVSTGETLAWLIKVIVMCLFILAPYIWIRLVFIPYANTMLKILNKDVNFQAIYLKYNITEREAEIIELIIDGKGNDEIKESLFISYHTVKNHLSNIYKKLNVKNRHELVHRFMQA